MHIHVYMYMHICIHIYTPIYTNVYDTQYSILYVCVCDVCVCAPQVMKHYPGNTNNSWTRQFFGDLTHGITRFDMFEFEPSTSGYTCDYVDSDGGAYPTVRAVSVYVCVCVYMHISIL